MIEGGGRKNSVGGWEKVRFLSAGISRPSDENQQKVVSRCCWLSLSLSLSFSPHWQANCIQRAYAPCCHLRRRTLEHGEQTDRKERKAENKRAFLVSPSRRKKQEMFCFSFFHFVSLLLIGHSERKKRVSPSLSPAAAVAFIAAFRRCVLRSQLTRQHRL